MFGPFTFDSRIATFAESIFGAFTFDSRTVVTLDIDGDGDVEPWSDGVLILRYLFGFLGTSLLGDGGGNQQACDVCDETAISAQLNLLETIGTLDVDKDTESNALTDGLLIMRKLLGLTGADLTTNAVGQNCSNCDSGQIEAYLKPLTE